MYHSLYTFILSEILIILKIPTLREETFADRNFRVFAFFGPFRESLCPRNFLITTIRESLCPRKFSENLFAKFYVQKFLTIWISIPEIQKIRGFNVLQLLFSVLISLTVVTYENLCSHILSKQTDRESLCPRNIWNLVIRESLCPRNTKISRYWLNRESFCPRKFLPLKYA